MYNYVTVIFVQEVVTNLLSWLLISFYSFQRCVFVHCNASLFSSFGALHLVTGIPFSLVYSCQSIRSCSRSLCQFNNPFLESRTQGAKATNTKKSYPAKIT